MSIPSTTKKERERKSNGIFLFNR